MGMALYSCSEGQSVPFGTEGTAYLDRRLAMSPFIIEFRDHLTGRY